MSEDSFDYLRKNAVQVREKAYISRYSMIRMAKALRIRVKRMADKKSAF